MVKIWSVNSIKNSRFEGLKFGAILVRLCTGGRGRSAPQGWTVRPCCFQQELHIIEYTFDQCA